MLDSFIHQNYLRVDQRLSVRAKSIKLLAENMGVNLHEPSVGKRLLDLMLQVKVTK